ncbi:NADH:flavin oxidoreductase/NADH oxidase [Orrella daihaiensis]|uniref:NADH:flavin oxidoreductase/NADH oxidase n=1 Tax=Orrella daihaiensis TaxID=2782176 RepID=A0ABY4AH66_9BURK|nr:NADH:flavin oxidoreductase/NADH oxidase [Orrella daihaiensis]UOD49633.1 NADH:flavin oxidoreductase/NADH oxidase [Orrella daihaiensis]
MSKLFSPIELGKTWLPNRIIVAPMCQYSAVDGNATDWHIIHLGNMAMSGAGLVILEATAVEPEGRITPGCLGLCNDDNEQALARVIQAVRKVSNAKLFIQLAHAGRKAASARPWDGGQQLPEAQTTWHTYAPSAIAHNEHEVPPHALDAKGLERIKQAFIESAKRSERLGLDGIELHAAHGYLLHEFLSPIANQRTDEYGGSLENRMRFVLEVFEAVRKAVRPEMPVGIRISACDWVDGGWTVEQSIELAHKLKEMGCDFIDVSSGGVSSAQTIKLEPGYQVPMARAIKAAVGMPTMAVGLITEPQQAESILQAGDADMIALARGMLYNPRWGWHAAAALNATVSAPPQYWRSQPRELKHLFENVTTGQR